MRRRSDLKILLIAGHEVSRSWHAPNTPFTLFKAANRLSMSISIVTSFFQGFDVCIFHNPFAPSCVRALYFEAQGWCISWAKSH